MIALLLGLIGLPTGIGLDWIVGRLAVPWEEDDEAPASPDAETPAGSRRKAGAELGSLTIDPARAARDWARRLAIVAVTAALFAGAGSRYHDPGHLAIVAAYVSVLIICAATDLLAYRVPNVVTNPAIVGAFVIAAVMPGAGLASAVAGAAVTGGALLVPSLLTGGIGMGMGDVKLATFVGLTLGLTFVVPALLVTALSGGAAAALLLITGARKRGEPIPYAPFVALGALVALLSQGTVFVSLG